MTTATQAKLDSKSRAKARPAAQPRPFTNPYLGGLFLGVVLFLAFYLTGNGLGASGGLNRMVVWLIDLAAPQYADRVSYLVQYAGGDKNALDNWIVLLTVGIFLGGLASGWRGRRIKWETVRGPQISDRQRWLFALLGGVIAGFGARMARGCTSGQGLSGGATLGGELGLPDGLFLRRLCPGLRPAQALAAGRGAALTPSPRSIRFGGAHGPLSPGCHDWQNRNLSSLRADRHGLWRRPGNGGLWPLD